MPCRDDVQVSVSEAVQLLKPTTNEDIGTGQELRAEVANAHPAVRTDALDVKTVSQFRREQFNLCLHMAYTLLCHVIIMVMLGLELGSERCKALLEHQNLAKTDHSQRILN